MKLVLSKIWTFEDALPLVRAIQPDAKRFGYQLTLGGEVLDQGFSDHSLDLYGIPLEEPPPAPPANPEGFWEFLTSIWGEGEKWTRETLSPEETSLAQFAVVGKFTYSGLRVDVGLLPPSGTQREGVEREATTEDPFLRELRRQGAGYWGPTANTIAPLATTNTTGPVAGGGMVDVTNYAGPPPHYYPPRLQGGRRGGRQEGINRNPNTFWRDQLAAHMRTLEGGGRDEQNQQPQQEARGGPGGEGGQQGQAPHHQEGGTTHFTPETLQATTHARIEAALAIPHNQRWFQEGDLIRLQAAADTQIEAQRELTIPLAWRPLDDGGEAEYWVAPPTPWTED